VSRNRPARKPIVTHLGTAMRSVRERAQISQDAVGSAVNLAAGTISDVESGRRSLGDVRLLEIERYLGCKPGLLIASAARDHSGIVFESGVDEDRDNTLALLAVQWPTLPAETIQSIRRVIGVPDYWPSLPRVEIATQLSLPTT
jgi:transcriptional regulator with XRE-family HTH domain